jgi:hypothetical protein
MKFEFNLKTLLGPVLELQPSDYTKKQIEEEVMVYTLCPEYIENFSSDVVIMIKQLCSKFNSFSTVLEDYEKGLIESPFDVIIPKGEKLSIYEFLKYLDDTMFEDDEFFGQYVKVQINECVFLIRLRHIQKKDLDKQSTRSALKISSSFFDHRSDNLFILPVSMFDL